MKPKTSPTYIGHWGVDMDTLYRRDETSFFVDSANHDGAVFKFPRGVPRHGAAVRVSQTWDACVRRGEDRHRPKIRQILRVYPLDAEIENPRYNRSFVLSRQEPAFARQTLKGGLDRQVKIGLGEPPHALWLTTSDAIAASAVVLMPPIAQEATPSWKLEDYLYETLPESEIAIR